MRLVTFPFLIIKAASVNSRLHEGIPSDFFLALAGSLQLIELVCSRRLKHLRHKVCGNNTLGWGLCAEKLAVYFLIDVQAASQVIQPGLAVPGDAILVR